MAPTNPTDRDLNALLARVAGIELAEFRPGEWYCVANPADIASGSARWSPLHDANQMERAEEAVRKMDVHIVYVWDGENHHWDLMPQTQFSKIHRAFDPDKKRAFALAVWAWLNERKEEKAICTDNMK